ncbi:MAG: hypothetical protein KGO52_16720 [Nitrospirota bacterium]|nr:hypothetical protein [Nitrospirota bacterium]MDE3244347.1 hypothetical protein [Nitrospirota bacterium]
MKRTIGMLVCMAVLGGFGLPMTAGAGVPDVDPPKKAMEKKDGAKKAYPDQVWASDTVAPEPPKKVAAPARKAKPYDGPIWSTDSAPADGK